MQKQITQEDLKKILEQVEKMSLEFESLRSLIISLLGEQEIPPAWLMKRLKVWAAIHRRGDIVDYEVFRNITESAGYDPRGVGGFFVGNNPSLVWVGENRVALARWAVDEVEKYKDWLDTVTIP
jgi:hypothetical protein